MTTLEDRIVTHPIAKAAYRLAEAESVYDGAGTTWAAENARAAGAALVAALDADGKRQAELEAAYGDLNDALGNFGTTGPTARAMGRLALAILTPPPDRTNEGGRLGCGEP